MKKFKRAFCTNTRLMGTMMLMVEWFYGFDIDMGSGVDLENRNKKEALDFGYDRGLVSHVFILDAEGLGISDLYILKDMDQEARDLFYRKKYGGLGGVNIDLGEDQVAYLVKKYKRKNEWYNKPLPEDFEEVYQDFYNGYDTESVDTVALFDSLCKEMESEYEFVNYMIMRFVARDWDGLLHYSGSDLVAASHISQINGALLYNYIERKSQDRYLCRAIYEDIDGYYDANIVVNIAHEDVEEDRLVYYDKPKKYSLRSFMVMSKEEIYDYEVFDMISKPEIVDIYQPIDDDYDMSKLASKLRGIYPGIQELAYEKGILFTQYYQDNSHLDSQVYLINNDLMFNIFLTENILYLATFDLDTRSFVEYVFKDSFGEKIRLVDSLEFEQNLLFDFVESGNDDFYDFLDN